MLRPVGINNWFWHWPIWWSHQMETFFVLLALCAGNSPVTGEFPAQRPVTRSFDVFVDLRLNIQLNKHSWGWWFVTLSRSLWRHCNAIGHITRQPSWYPAVQYSRYNALGKSSSLSFHLQVPDFVNELQWLNFKWIARILVPLIAALATGPIVPW